MYTANSYYFLLQQAFSKLQCHFSHFSQTALSFYSLFTNYIVILHTFRKLLYFVILLTFRKLHCRFRKLQSHITHLSQTTYSVILLTFCNLLYGVTLLTFRKRQCHFTHFSNFSNLVMYTVQYVIVYLYVLLLQYPHIRSRLPMPIHIKMSRGDLAKHRTKARYHSAVNPEGKSFKIV